ncbi:unnamed protein product [Dicrocoelium dendriticum]|nr:unnamed protein product [Dicrocoelium dendriticum]
MLWDEAFITNALDVPIQEVIPFDPPVSVKYVTDREHNLWSKVINLELCDRQSLSSLMANVGFIRELSFTHLIPEVKKGLLGPPADAFLSFPTSIKLEQCFMTISHPLSTYGSAYDVMRRIGSEGLTEKLVAAIIARTLLCVERLHAQGVMHRGLCAGHLLLVHNESSSSNIQVRLCGLGSLAQSLSSHFKVARNDLPQIHFSWRGWNVQRSPNGNLLYGHPVAWYSPEMIAQDFNGYSLPSDVYSLGLTIAELFTGRVPFAGLKPTVIALKKLSEQEVPDLNLLDTNEKPPSQGMRDVYAACTHFEPSKRPSAKQLLQMPWIEWGLRMSLEPSDLDPCNTSA